MKRIEGTTACLLHSFKLYLPMNGSKSCGSKCFPLFFYMLTILVLSVIYIGNCLEISYPGKESFRILSDHFWKHVLLEKTHHICHKAICEHKRFVSQSKLQWQRQNTPNREKQCQVFGAMCKHLQSTHIRISRPSNSSNNTLEWHKNTTSHVTTHLSEAFAVDFRKHLLPKNQRCSQPLATEPPQASASASSAGAAATGWGTASTASGWKIHPWGNVVTSGTQKVI